MGTTVSINSEWKEKMNRVEKPWGYYEDYYREDHCVFKKIVVNPGERLSYQYHLMRGEFWFVHEGTGVITVEGDNQYIKPGFFITILPQIDHRVHNTGQSPLVIYEMQFGRCYEDDILRLQDDYKRNDNSKGHPGKTAVGI